jgi:hypothetical protein
VKSVTDLATSLAVSGERELLGLRAQGMTDGMTDCQRQSEYDGAEATVTAFFTFNEAWREGVGGKWLNLRNLVGDGTPLATSHRQMGVE